MEMDFCVVFCAISTTYTGADHSRLYHKSRLFTQSTSLNQSTGHVLTETLVTWEVITLLKPISTQNDFPQKEIFCKIWLADTNFPSEKKFEVENVQLLTMTFSENVLSVEKMFRSGNGLRLVKNMKDCVQVVK
jgi:hypothetical protein